MSEQIEGASRALGQLVARVWQDEAFLARLSRDPRGALKECGVDLPSDAAPKVIWAEPGEIYIIVPAKPDASLGEEELQAASGGFTTGLPICFYGGCACCR